MNHLVAVAIGGAFGAMLRFLISSGVYQWLGKGFPYGTLAVNVIGSFLIGLMTVALPLQRVALTMEYRSAILVGLFGSLTTFSTFSLDNFYLIEQGLFVKASLNILANVFVCIIAVWIGVTLAKVIFSTSAGVAHWKGWVIPYGLLIINMLGAFITGVVGVVLLYRVELSVTYAAALVVMVFGLYVTLSSLYLVLYFIEHHYAFSTHFKSILGAVIVNIITFSSVLWLGVVAGRNI